MTSAISRIRFLRYEGALGVKIVSTLGIDGLSLGHYDGATFELLDAVKEGMKNAGMEVCTK